MIYALRSTLNKLVKLLLNTIIITLSFAGILFVVERQLPTVVEHVEVAEAAVDKEPTLDELVEEVATSYDLPPLLLRAIVRHESGDDPDALRFEAHHMPRGKKIAKNESQARMYATSIGLAQVMGWHAPEYNLSWKDLLDPRKNLIVASEILTKCKARAKGNKREKMRAMLGCYNGDRTNYPPKVYAALGEIVAERM